MIRRALFAVLLLAAPLPAAAQWAHAPSGIRIPDRIDGMRRGEVRDLSNGAALNMMLQYGDADEPATVYVYRSSHPNAGLWFERTRIAMQANVGAFDAAQVPTPFAFAGAARPNGLRETYAMAAGGPWKATSVAIAHHGEWLVKARLTSKSLGVAALDAKMSRLLAAIEARGGTARILPLASVEACPATQPAVAAPITEKEARGIVAMSAAIEGIVVGHHARGGAGLAAEPAAWCRAATALPAKMFTVYRRRDGGGWVSLIGDSGYTSTGYALATSTPKGAGAVYVDTPEQTTLVEVFDRLPEPDMAIGGHVIPVLTGQRQPMATIGTTAK